MNSLLELAAIHAPTAERLRCELAEVEVVFERQLASDLPAVNALCRHVERYRGKMLRPTLVLLTGLACRPEDPDGPLSEGHRVVGAVTEMIHMATLVHDDVLDEAEIRRKGATVNHLRGNEMAVMLGDYLISNAYHLCSKLGAALGDPTIAVILGETTNTLCEGELVQLHHRDNLSLDEATYFEIVRRKTAALVGVCCRLGASLSGAAPEVVDALRRFGIALGIAFQIQDDLLDLVGRPEVVGKSLGRDLDKGKLTLPVILHLAAADPPARSEAIELIGARDAETLRGRLGESGAIDAARERAHALVEEARDVLTAVPPTPARALLAAMADAVVARDW
ncbi:MAG TPA: polyprenyl synthetase family protein [Phycisphaerales bacterium]|nr:polyprenyl synthetase family protein [Phycisphaerales bacterium]HMP36830.1 polyprenyl synthetase family protein [Phycisphaerales bacterium]